MSIGPVICPYCRESCPSMRRYFSHIKGEHPDNWAEVRSSTKRLFDAVCYLVLFILLMTIIFVIRQRL